MVASIPCRCVNVPAIANAPYRPRLIYLHTKAAKLHNLIAQETQFQEIHTLYHKLKEVQAEIYEVNMNPLEYDLCVEQPWASECKVFDF